jgi:hypothetical protein
MDIDLLRRAAAKLRKHAEAAPEGPWVSLDDGDRLVALRPTWAKGFRYLVDEPIDDTSTAEYFALMHPPVALAVAKLLDEAAEEIEANVPGFDWIHLYDAQFAVARAVLREDGA